jgi:hypothetical protein
MDELNPLLRGQDYQQTFQAAPEWLQNFLKSEAEKSRTGNFKELSDVLDQYMPQIRSKYNQAGENAFYNPAFLRASAIDKTNYNPFTTPVEFGRTQYGGIEWRFDPFTGLNNLDGSIDWLKHNLTHRKAVKKAVQRGEQGAVDFLKTYAPEIGDDLRGSDTYLDRYAFNRAQQDLDYLYDLKSRYGGY